MANIKRLNLPFWFDRATRNPIQERLVEIMPVIGRDGMFAYRPYNIVWYEYQGRAWWLDTSTMDDFDLVCDIVNPTTLIRKSVYDAIRVLQKEGLASPRQLHLAYQVEWDRRSFLGDRKAAAGIKRRFKAFKQARGL